MRRGSMFGWDLPPGVTSSMIDPPEEPCIMCGMMPDDCVCPICPKCDCQGDPHCYVYHGLIATKEQIASLGKFQDHNYETMMAERKYWDQVYEDWKAENF